MKNERRISGASQDVLVKNGLVDNFGQPVLRDFRLPGFYLSPHQYIVGIAPMVLKEGGSLQCNFLVLYDPQTKVGAVAHVDFSELSRAGFGEDDIARLISQSVEEMVETVDKSRLQAAVISRERGIEDLDVLARTNSNILTKTLAIIAVPFSPVKGTSDAVDIDLSNGEIRDGNKGNSLFKFSGVSPVVSEESGKNGGIDFRALPAVNLPGNTAALKLSSADLSRLSSLNLDAEWVEIQNMVNSEIIPSNDRIKEYLLASCLRQGLGSQMNKVLGCIADIMRLEEDRVVDVDAQLKDLLVIIESGKPESELQLSLSQINFISAEQKSTSE